MLDRFTKLFGGRPDRIQLGLSGTHGDAPSVHSTANASGQTPRGVEPAERWEPRAVELYDTLIRARMGEQTCRSCGRSLEAASLDTVSGGTTLDEHCLTDTAAAKLLAYTQCLLVRCSCGVAEELGISAPSPQPSPQRRTRLQRHVAWSAGYAEVYQSLLRARMRECDCGTCGRSLETASITKVDGGDALDEHGLSDEQAARVLALTQRLSVLCSECGTVTNV